MKSFQELDFGEMQKWSYPVPECPLYIFCDIKQMPAENVLNTVSMEIFKMQ